MTRYWQQFSEKFNRLAKRERVILLVAVLAVVYLLWSWLFLTPVTDKIDSLQTQKQTLGQRVIDLQAQAQVFSQAAGRDSNTAKERRIGHLQERLDALDKKLQTLAVGLVPADRLPQVLHDVLSTTGELKLLGMHTLPVEKLSITNEAADTQQESQQVDVYRHAVELRVRGRYFAVARYLQALEELPWRFYWDTLNYQVDNYPLAVATLQVYTLSAGEGSLGE